MTTPITSHRLRFGSGARHFEAARQKRRWAQIAQLSAWGSALFLAVIFGIGIWMRRWISDDGLIVLRTVRNLLAGNGPVFNAGERVEANTSTLWQYVIYLGALISDKRLETIALYAALTFSVLAIAIAAIATSRLYSPRRWFVFLPLGGVIYLALPPARDFGTAGLEWGLAIFWLAIQWLLLVEWVRPGDDDTTRPRSSWIWYALAFWSGLSWLVRPELAIYGGLTGIVLVLAATQWKQILGIILVAIPVPGAYQIFRMGYYALITPHTAVAKSAGDAEWSVGWDYVQNFLAPYHLEIVLALVGVAAIVLFARRRAADPSGPTKPSTLSQRLQSPTAVSLLITGAGVIHLVYFIRVGGDFMHGRMMLIPLFALLLPVMIVPVFEMGRPLELIDAVIPVVLAGVYIWAGLVMAQGTDFVDRTDYEYGELSIVDEREFWTNATRREGGDPPRYAEDFLTTPAMRHWQENVAETMAGDDALQYLYPENYGAKLYSWAQAPRNTQVSDLSEISPTVYFLNLGMTSMMAPLDMRVVDPVGLATPLGARQPRLIDGRVGHDKELPVEWQVADTDLDLAQAPPWVDKKEALLARAALHSPEVSRLLASSREPMSVQRFFANIRYALTEGRTLQLTDDPRDYLSEQTVREISELAARLEENPQAQWSLEGVDGVGSARISWPKNIGLDDRW